MDLSSSNTAWIWAVHAGPAIASNDVSARLSKHDEKDAITLDLTKARGGDSLNPFLAVAEGGATKTASADVAGSTGLESKTGNNGGRGGSNEPVNAASGSGRQKGHRMLVAHGVLMALAMVVVFPAGAVLVRVVKGKGTTGVWVHSGTQAFGYMIALAGMGLGVWLVTAGGVGEVSAPISLHLPPPSPCAV